MLIIAIKINDMKPVNNPYAENKNFNCIGCSPNHPFGLKLEFKVDELNGIIESEWNPSNNFEGYHNVVHGGIQATMLDEIASWAIYTLLKTGGVTSQMHITYHKPVFISKGSIKLKASIIKTDNRLVDIKAELYSAEGKLCTEAIVQYFYFPEKIAREKYGYPGIDAFLK